MALAPAYPCETTPRTAAAPLDRPGSRWVLAASIIGSSLAFIDGSVVGVALPAMQRALGAGLEAMQWVVNGYALMLGALILIGGAAGDRFGRRRLFVLGVALFAAASAACALAPDAGWLVAFRAVQGVGAALVTPNSLALISASFTGKARTGAIGAWAGFAALTTAAGPVLGGWLADTVGWRTIFLINLPPAALAVALAWRHVPESRGPESGPIDWRGAVLATVGLAAVTWGLTAARDAGLGSPIVLGPLAAGMAVLAAFVWNEARAKAPMTPLDLFGSVTFSAANVLTFLLYFALGGALFLLPFDLIQLQGYSAAGAGLALLPFTLVMGLLSQGSGVLAERVGARPVLVAGPLLTAAGFAWLGWTGGAGGYWGAVAPGLLLSGLGMAVCVPALTSAVMSAAPDANAGAASGVNNAVARLAGLFAVAVLALAAQWAGQAALDASVPAGLRGLVHPGDQLGAVVGPAGMAVTASIRAAGHAAGLASVRATMYAAAAFAGLGAVAGALCSPRPSPSPETRD